MSSLLEENNPTDEHLAAPQTDAAPDSPLLATEALPVSTLTLAAQLEALLFVAPGAVTVAQLAAALRLPGREVEQALKELESQFNGPERGLRLQWHAGRVQMTSAAEAGLLVEQFLGLEASNRLSRAALEALAIVAYQQPVTRPEIDAVRGVNSDGVMKSLLSKGLVQEAGRAERVGRPILYTTSADFLSYFGLNSLTELPPLSSIDSPPSEEDTDKSLDLLKT